MTYEKLRKAEQIQKDIKAIQIQTLEIDASKELRESWFKWADEHLSRLKKEFDEL